jgi:YVTN family beta-propeller protein
MMRFAAAAMAAALAMVLSVAPSRAQNAYITNSGGNTVSVIDTASSTVTATIPIGAVTPDGSKVYVVNGASNTVSVIATASNTVIKTVTVGNEPYGVAVDPDGSKVYVTNTLSHTVSVIATATNTVIGSPITVGNGPSPVGNFIGPPVLTIAKAGTGSGQSQAARLASIAALV